MTAAPATTVDAFLGGRVEAIQPAKGHHRSGLDAALLAAALPADLSGLVADLGAGAGVAGFCVAARCPDAEVVLVERDPELAGLAAEALRLPANAAFAGRVRVLDADIASVDAIATRGTPPPQPSPRGGGGGAPPQPSPRGGGGGAAAVIANPPFHDPGAVRASPEGGKAVAHVLGAGGLDPWFRAAVRLLAPGGLLVTILRAGTLGKALAAAERRFGGLHVLPVHPRAQLPATRILIAGRKGARADPRILPGLVLHGAEGSRFLPPVEAMLRDGAGLADVHPAWRAAAGAPS